MHRRNTQLMPWGIVLLVVIAGVYAARRGIVFIRRARAALAQTSAEGPVPAGRHRHEP
ncbi:hypothetical protein [Arthrobacter ramosus]|uniref:Uncharacterized protein n=1 Tax=Arthrobacter ramosus TaxID=1672 RepID=A0ABV5Y5A0_ARTRM|nr:hypothetical protein [Arthrobacter ramosus]